jgi:hypothetical protein
MWKKYPLLLCAGLALFAAEGKRLKTGHSVPAAHQIPQLLAEQASVRYTRHTPEDPVAELNRKIQKGLVHLEFQERQGYLRSVLKELNVPVESQIMVFSKTSFQASLINPGNPRTLYFNDSVTVGWVHGGSMEFAAEDPREGTIFYLLRQEQRDKPELVRSEMCLLCHVTPVTLGIPGMFARSVMTASDGSAMPQLGYYFSDHRSPMNERWGGWYVTGRQTAFNHMGNTVLNDRNHMEPLIGSNALSLKVLEGKFDLSGYLSPYSDVVALMVFDHQVHMTDLLIRMNRDAESALPGTRTGRLRAVTGDSSSRSLDDSAKELVDYLMFIDEAPVPGPIEGSSGFAEKFATLGPADSKGRSLRQFDLQHRLMRYPCSYMIYSSAFNDLPDRAKAAIYRRMWVVLSGQAKAERYARLSLQDRKAVVEILRETKKDLPSYFLSVR